MLGRGSWGSGSEHCVPGMGKVLPPLPRGWLPTRGSWQDLATSGKQPRQAGTCLPGLI